jgi:hypothetical protein
VDIAAGWTHTCARSADHTIRCWGEGVYGDLGDGTFQNAGVPVLVSGITTAVGLTAGWWHHSCALLADGNVRCWGTNDWGQLGNGTTSASGVPVNMTGLGVTWTSSTATVATIDATGRATAVGPGVTTITATDMAGNIARTTLAVNLPRYTLTVVKSGLAAGIADVSSSPAGISCGPNCSSDYTSGTVVTLTASPGALNTSWIGCDSVDGSTCTVTMRSARTVTANFITMTDRP